MTSQQEKSQVSISVEALRGIAKTHGFTISQQDEPGYLAVVRSAQESVEYVKQMEDYVDPSLARDVNSNDHKARTYAVPLPEENPLNAWSHRTHIQVPANNAGLLTGKTVAIKDNMSVAGVPLTIGTQPFHLSKETPYPIPELDVPVVSRVLAAGGAIVGTSTCENYCLSAMSFTSAIGPVDNPYLRGYSAGGSSSGSAALVAINLIKKRREACGLSTEDLDLGEGVDVAMGADQGGSIRVPAAYCGIYGLKPTHGLVPYTGIGGLFPLLDHCGPLAPSVRDTALLLSAIAGYDGFDPRMTPETPLRAAVPQYHTRLDEQIAARTAAGTWTPQSAAYGLRIGILSEAFQIAGLSTDVSTIIRKAAARYTTLGASVDEVSVPLHLPAPHIFTAATRAYATDYLLFGHGAATSASLAFPFPSSSTTPGLDQTWYDTMTKSNPLVVGGLLSSEFLKNNNSEAVRDKAVRLVHRLRAAYDEVLEHYDVLVMPATPTVAPRHADVDMGVGEKAGLVLANTLNTLPFNVTGHPGLVIPVGWGRAEGGDEGAKLPIGMQIVGKRWDEETLFLAAAAWEVGGLGLDEE